MAVYRVLIVDDSHFFQSRLKKIINEHPQLEIVAIASNGLEAIEKDKIHKPDVITMDYEMPGMDGITALKAILSNRKVPILMFSSMTFEGAAVTLDALDAGAVDYIPKSFSEVTQDSLRLKSLLHEKLITFSQKYKSIPQLSTLNNTQTKQADTNNAANNIKGKIKLIVIGASTGGPIALAEIITRLPANFSIPIIIAQHMPASFTPAFSERLNKLSALNIKEARHHDQIKRGTVLIAPGGLQTMIDKSGQKISIIEGDERVLYKPSVDVLFASAANAFGQSALGVVLTGMGRDGYDGAKIIRSQGGHIWSQDKQSAVIFGMPGAVQQGKLSQNVLPISQFSKHLMAIQ